jgi:hypothetical protein
MLAEDFHCHHFKFIFFSFFNMNRTERVKRAQALKTYDEILGSSSTPPDIRAIINFPIKPANPQRFKLAMYMIGNGISPQLTRELILDLWYNQFDQEALRHIAYITTPANIKDTWKYFDLHNRQVCYVNTGKPDNLYK